MKTERILLAAAFFIFIVSPATAQLQLEVAFTNLSFTRPVELQHAGDGTNRLFVVEQAGVIKVFENAKSTASAKTFLNITDRVNDSGNEEGLLGLAFHPDYENNGYFYVDYTASNPRRTVISRFSVSATNPDSALKSTEFIVIEIPINLPNDDNHNGGKIAFGSDGFLYIGPGDGGSGGDPTGNGQNLLSLLGKILRIDVDNPSGANNYGIPADNPFVGNTSAKEEIYAYGFRNPWRFSFDPVTNQLWLGDVGQGRREEVDIVEKGMNYGWNRMEGNLCYPSGADPCNIAGLAKPIWDYPRNEGQSITGGYVYRGTLAPGLEGVYLYGDYCTGIIWTMQRDSGGRWVSIQFMDTDFNISSFGEDVRGDVYVTDLGGSVLRLEAVTPPATPSPTFTPTASQTPPSTLTPMPTLTPTVTASHTSLPTLTATPTLTPSETASQTPLPTLTATFTPTGTPPPTLTATLPPTNTFEPTPTEVLPPTSTPEPTLTLPSGPTLFVQVIPPAASVGETVAATLNMTNVTGLYGLQAACSVDPAVLSSVGQADGSGFNIGNSYIVDHGFQPDGRWLVAASRLAPSEAITGGAVAFSLVYRVRSEGSSPVTCDVLAVDKDGKPVALTVVNGSFNSTTQPTATIEPTLTETPVIEPTFTETPTAEATNTETPEVVTTPDPTGQSTISGNAAYQNRADDAGITVQLLGLDGALVAETVTAADGAYTFADVALGAYMLQAGAPLHVTLQRALLVEANGQMIAVPETVLPGGDTDDNGLIDITDATFIGANYDVSAPPAPANADLNSDGLVNITDLVLVGGNFGLTGPVVVE